MGRVLGCCLTMLLLTGAAQSGDPALVPVEVMTMVTP